MTFTKSHLQQYICDTLGLTGTQAKEAVQILFDTLAEAMIDGHRIEIRGFGSWEILETNPRPKARNPKTGETFALPARRKVRFKPGKDIRQALTQPRQIEVNTL